MPSKEELAHMTGVDNGIQFRSFPRLKLNGAKGHFVLTTKKGDEYIDTEVKETPDVIILKVRRKLVAFQKAGGKEIIYSTTEHAVASDYVTLFKDNAKYDEGTAKELREKYEFLRTHQVVYVLYKNQVVALTVKGSSLAKYEDKEKLGFYDYIQSFDRKNGEHAYLFHTILNLFTQEGKLGDYYSINFTRGAGLTDEEFTVVSNHIQDLFGYFEEIDKQRNLKKTQPVATSSEGSQPDPEEDLPTIQQDSEELMEEVDRAFPTADQEVNVDDIPFYIPELCTTPSKKVKTVWYNKSKQLRLNFNISSLANNLV